MKLELSAAAVKVACTVAASCVIGGGTMVLNTATATSENTGRIDEIQEHQNKVDDALDRLDQSVRNLDKNVAVLNERLRER